METELGGRPVHVRQERAERVRPHGAVVGGVHDGAPAGHRDAHGDGLHILPTRCVRFGPLQCRLGGEARGRGRASEKSGGG